MAHVLTAADIAGLDAALRQGMPDLYERNDVTAAAHAAFRIGAWATDVRFQSLCLNAILKGRCGVRVDGTAVQVTGMTVEELLALAEEDS